MRSYDWPVLLGALCGASLCGAILWKAHPTSFVVTNTFTCFTFRHVSMFWQHANHVICWGQLMQVMDHDITRSSLHTCKLVLAQQLCKTCAFNVFSWKYIAKPLWNQWNIKKIHATMSQDMNTNLLQNMCVFLRSLPQGRASQPNHEFHCF